MTTKNENTPVAGQGNEGNEQIDKSSSADQPTVTTLRLHRRGGDTGMTYGTEAGDDLPHHEWWPVLIPVATLRDATRGPVSVVVSPEDIKAQSARVRRARRRTELDRRVRQRIGDLEDKIRAEVEAELDNEGN